MDYTVVIPAYNEAHALPRLLPEVLRIAPNVIVVDDGSSDNTTAIAQHMGANVVRHARNAGKGAAVLTGLRASPTEFVVLMDGDGQHDPRDAPRLVGELEQGYDLVIGDRFAGLTVEMPMHRKLANGLIRAIVSSKTHVNDPLCGYRAVRRSHFLNLKQAGYETETEMVLHAHRKGLRVKELPVRVRYNGLNVQPKTGLETYLRILSYALRGRLE